MEAFSMDFGNRKVKLVSAMTVARMLEANKTKKPDLDRSTEELVGAKIFPSFYMDYDDLGDQSTALSDKAMKIDKYKSSLDKDFSYAWGENLYLVHAPNSFIQTMGIEGRYSRREFKLLCDFGLAELARDYDKALSSILSVSLTVCVPTDDLTTETVKALSDILLGDHNVVIDDQSLNVRVEQLEVQAQPVGTVYNEVLDLDGYIIEEKEHLLSEQVVVVDLGGGTLIVDTLTNMNLNKPHDQKPHGAYKLYEYIVDYAKKDGVKGITVDEVEYALRTQNAATGYTFKPSKNVSHDISAHVRKATLKYTREAINIVSTTLKEASRIDEILITGGTSHLIDKVETKDQFPYSTFVQHAEVANALGFYKKLVGDLAEAAEEAQVTSITEKAKGKGKAAVSEG